MRPYLHAGVFGTLLLSLAAVGGTIEAGAGKDTAPATEEHQQAVAVTIYNGNLGLVKDIRKIQLAPGIHDLQFMDEIGRAHV